MEKTSVLLNERSVDCCFQIKYCSWRHSLLLLCDDFFLISKSSVYNIFKHMTQKKTRNVVLNLLVWYYKFVHSCDVHLIGVGAVMADSVIIDLTFIG